MDLNSLSDQQLRDLEKSLVNDVSNFKVKQKALKISLNSLYGALGNNYFRYFDIRMAEAVTITGQFIIRYIAQGVNDYLNQLMKTSGIDYVIAGDTDSIYVSFDAVVKKLEENVNKVTDERVTATLDRIARERIEPLVDRLCAEIVEYLNAPVPVLKMKREVIANTGIWIAKKRYMLNVINSEGVQYAKPKLKMMGIEAVKSSTPSACRAKIKEAIGIILSGDEEGLIRFIKQFRKEFRELPPDEIAFPRGVSNVDKYVDAHGACEKGTPIHCRASIVFNRLLVEHGLTGRYEKIRSGDKIKFIYLTLPNTVQENVVAFLNVLPEEFDVAKYIDYDLQFLKGFLSPLQLITNAIGWETEKRNTIEEFFG